MLHARGTIQVRSDGYDERVTPLRGTAYGLSIEADGAIPGLGPPCAASSGRLEIFLRAFPEASDGAPAHLWYTSEERGESGQPSLQVWALSGGLFHRLLYADDTEFIVDSAGTQIWTRWPDCLSVEDMATYLLGPVMGFVLLLRGVICLHASAVVIGNSVVAIAGQAEAGKSTVAAAFARQSYPVLSDDVVTLDEHGGRILVQPAYPRIRLWPDSVGALYGEVDALPRLTPTWDKRYLDLTTNGYRFQNAALPLSAVYVLAERQADPHAPRVESIPRRDALVALVANTYMTHLMDRAMRRRAFDILTHVIERVFVRRVVPHLDLGHIDALCEAILDDFHALHSSG
jgi:hypothetical protein